MATPEHGLKELRSDLARLGIRPGDTVIVHSSMKSIGRVRGGPQAVVRALQQTVTPAGTILMPAFSYSCESAYEAATPYDPARSPSKVGLLAETFRKMKGVRRSAHPTHSVAAWGRRADEFLAGHERLGGLAADTPFHRAAKQGARLCLIGCDFTALSLLHVAEEVAGVPYVRIFNWLHAGWRPTALVKRGRRTVPITYPTIPGCSQNFRRAEELARREGLLREGRLGDAKVLLAEAGPLLDRLVAQVKREPDFLLCPPTTCRACDERRATMTPTASATAEFVRDVLIEIVTKAGFRVAGSAGEDKAAALIRKRMDDLGLANVRIHRFPLTAWQPGRGRLRVEVNGRWEEVPCLPAAHAPASAGEISGESVNIESLDDLDKVRVGPRSVGVLWGSYGDSPEALRRLMGAGFKAIIMVDTRFEHSDPVAIGFPARWVRHVKRPMISVPFAHAVRLFDRSRRCRLSVTGRNVPGRSTIVSGEITGARPDAILICGHHDSTLNSFAVDDNLSGVGVTLAVASLLAGGPRLRRPFGHAQGGPEPRRMGRTVRFVSFGAEEQLSEGARWYALDAGLGRNVRFVLNSDSVGARIGTTTIHVTGPAAMTDWLRRRARRSPLQFNILEDIGPFSDQFPFNTLGVPSLWFYRQTTASGRHFHHTVRDTLAEMSFDGIARLAEFQAQLVRALARPAEFPFPARLPASVLRQAHEMRRTWLE